VVIYHYAQQPKESVIEELRRFMREVKPALDDVLRRQRVGAPAEVEARA
jgi:dsDNA-binding SOS-regulon protein